MRATGPRVIPCSSSEKRVIRNTMLNISEAPSRPASTGARANRMGPAPLMPTHDVNNLALKESFLKGSRHSSTLAGRAMNIINRPISRAGIIIGTIWEGLASSPSSRNITSCISQVIPSKKLRISLRRGSSALLPMIMAAM